MLDNVKNILTQPKIQILFSENPDVYVKIQVRIWIQRPQITLKHICLVLRFFQTENLLHSVLASCLCAFVSDETRTRFRHVTVPDFILFEFKITKRYQNLQKVAGQHILLWNRGNKSYICLSTVLIRLWLNLSWAEFGIGQIWHRLNLAWAEFVKGRIRWHSSCIPN